MRKLLDKLRQSLVLRVGAIYAMSAVLIGSFASEVLPAEWSAGLIGYFVSVLALIYFFIVLYVTWIIDSVNRQDRFVFLVQIAWVYSPILLVNGALMLIFGAFIFSPFNPLLEGFTPETHFFLEFGLLEYVAVVWMLMSARVARSWATSKAEDADLLYRAEEGLFFGIDQDQCESRISARMYYSFIAGLAAILFMIIDTAMSEFIDEAFELPGYAGAIATTFGIAAVLYPFHKIVSKSLSFNPDQDDDCGADDIKSAAKEVAGSYFKWEFQMYFSDWSIKRVLPLVVIMCIIVVANIIYLFL